MSATTTTTTAGAAHTGLFTCVTCGVGFAAAEGQRAHYKTEWHRYNLKRKVADLRPVSEGDFAARVAAQQQRDQAAEAKAAYSGRCDACGKGFATLNAYENHVQSRRHLANVKQQADGAAARRTAASTLPAAPRPDVTWESLRPAEAGAAAGDAIVDVLATQLTKGVVIADEDGDGEGEGANGDGADGEAQTLSEMDYADDKIANARFLSPLECIFCTHVADSFDANVEHIATRHSFFIPDLEYLVDLPGLIRYLGEKVSVGNACLYCNKVFWTMEAVQKHMADKGHVKLLYEGDAELEVSDFYDFRASYPDHGERAGDGDDESLTAADELSQALIINDETAELMLPSGARLGNRTYYRYYRQKLKPEDTRESVQISRLMSSYKALGWHGGQPPAAQRDMTSYLRRKQDWRTKVGVQANKLQKHFRHHVIF